MVSGDVKVMNNMGAKLTRGYRIRVVVNKKQEVLPYLARLDDREETVTNDDLGIITRINDPTIPISAWKDLSDDERYCFSVESMKIALDEYGDYLSKENFASIAETGQEIENAIFDPQNNTSVIEAVRKYCENIKLESEKRKKERLDQLKAKWEEESTAIKDDAKRKLDREKEEAELHFAKLNQEYAKYEDARKERNQIVEEIEKITGSARNYKDKKELESLESKKEGLQNTMSRIISTLKRDHDSVVYRINQCENHASIAELGKQFDLDFNWKRSEFSNIKMGDTLEVIQNILGQEGSVHHFPFPADHDTYKTLCKSKRIGLYIWYRKENDYCISPRIDVVFLDDKAYEFLWSSTVFDQTDKWDAFVRTLRWQKLVDIAESEVNEKESQDTENDKPKKFPIRL